jgi:hypothetical protein
MRAAVLTLLWLLLPGILLPAGLWLHVCRCAPREVRVATCCATADPAEPAADLAGGQEPRSSRPSCCAHHELRPTGAPADPPSATADECGCVWVTVGDDQPEPNRPAPFDLALPAPKLRWRAPWPPLRRAVELRAPAWAVVRPPPDHHRSLPLRL